MHCGIGGITESLFRTIPYSSRTQKAKESITQALTREFEKALECGNEIQALGHVMTRFGTLEGAAKLAGYSPEEISAWQTAPALGSLELKKQFRRARRKIYCTALFFGICILYTVELFAWQNPWFLLFIAPCAAIGLAAF